MGPVEEGGEGLVRHWGLSRREVKAWCAILEKRSVESIRFIRKGQQSSPLRRPDLEKHRQSNSTKTRVTDADSQTRTRTTHDHGPRCHRPIATDSEEAAPGVKYRVVCVP
jgi:hypothetical protein